MASVIEPLLDEKHGRGLGVDIGSGSGAFALALKKQNFFDKVVAMDFSQDCINKCASLGLDTIHGSVEKLEDNSCDFFSMNDLIEHLFNPQKFICECREKLKSGGILSIACPNGEGFDFKLMKQDTVNVHPPEHLQYFNTYSIELLLQECGFEPISIETPGILDVQIVKREVDNKNFILKSNDFIQFLLSECPETVQNNFQKFLSENKLSSHLQVIAKKVTT